MTTNRYGVSLGSDDMFHSWIEVTAARYHESTKCHQIIHFKWFILCYGNSISTCVFFFKSSSWSGQ